MKHRFVFICADCNKKFIATQFCNGIVRLLCPVCKGKMFFKMGKHGLEKVKCYSEYRS